MPATLTHLLLPPLHAGDWKALLGLWLQRWVSSHRSLFPSLFLPKIRVAETRSATLGDRIYNYRKWQQRWTPDTSFPCRCIDVADRTTLHAHSHAAILNDFGSINAAIDPDIMFASMKDQYYGDVDKLQQRFTFQLRKLARRWKVQRSSLEVEQSCRNYSLNIAPIFKTRLTGPLTRYDSQLAPSMRGLSFRQIIFRRELMYFALPCSPS